MRYCVAKSALKVSTCLSLLMLVGCGLTDSNVTIQNNGRGDKDQSADMFKKDMPIHLDMHIQMPVDMGKDLTTPPDMKKDPPDMKPMVDMKMDPPDMKMDPPDMKPMVDMNPPPVPPSDPVEQVVTQGCSTTLVKGLSQQLIDEMNCVQPNLMRSIAHVPELSFYAAVFPYLQDPASRSIESVVKNQNTLTISSALRTLPQQYLLYRWYQLGRCNIGLAAKPGRSNHNGGLAIDTPNYSAWKTRFNSSSWSWLGNSDPVHFNFNGGSDVRNVSVLALQRLHNRNNPADQIAEDGAYGPQTEARMKQAPSMGYPKGASCQNSAFTDGRDAPMSLVFEGDPSTLRRVQTIAPSAIKWVEYTWKGKLLASRARTQDMRTNFPLAELPNTAGTLIATGYDLEGRILGRAIAQRFIESDMTLVWQAQGAGLYSLSVSGPAWINRMSAEMANTTLEDTTEEAAKTALRIVVSVRPNRGQMPLVVSLRDETGKVRRQVKLLVHTE